MPTAAGIKGKSMFFAAQISLQTSLRWMRRIMTMVLILSNFAATMLADASRGRFADARLIGSLLICLLFIALMRMLSRRKSASTLTPRLSFIRSGLK